jgi:rifampicin phosphotransferase
VPAAVCLTTEFCERWLEASGLDVSLRPLIRAASDRAERAGALREMRVRIQAAPVPEPFETLVREGVGSLDDGRPGSVAVRSSGVYEDARRASHAASHASLIVPDAAIPAVIEAVKSCWASLWTEVAWSYRERLAIPHVPAANAVVIQRFVAAECSGVAFSADPLTGDRATVVIDAGWGTGAALVGGRMTPDEYRVSMNGGAPAVMQRRTGRIDPRRRGQPVLRDAQALEIAEATKRMEHALDGPVDVEWVFDGRTIWAVQARLITTLNVAPRRPGDLRTPLWTRANLKEVFPEVPSPVAVTYLTVALNRMFRSYHAANGYVLPAGASLVSVIRGRPYLNLSLMQGLAIERGGDPAIVGRLFGGAPPSTAATAKPSVPPGLSVGAQVRLVREMLATFFRTPRRGRQLFGRLRREAAMLADMRLDVLDDRALTAHFRDFSTTLLHETTLCRLHEVVSAQSRAYMVLEALLTAWVPTGADTLMKHVMTGFGTLPNVRMTDRLMDLAAVAARDPAARAYFTRELDADAVADFEAALADTAVWPVLDAFLRDFGHRGSYESDVMSPRFAEDPALVLRLIQLHVRAGATQRAAEHAAERRRVREVAMAHVRLALRYGRGRLAFAAQWWIFSTVCRALQRLLGLRDECRHVTAMLVAHLRRVLLEMGRRAARAGVLSGADDIFFLVWEEVPHLLAEPGRAWGARVAHRRRERASNARLDAPDLVAGDRAVSGADVAAGPDRIAM